MGRRGKRRAGWCGGLVALALGFSATIAAGARAETQVDLALVLAVDASGSVDMHRFELQKQGYAVAFRNPRVLNAIRSGLTQSIAVTMFQWTGPRLQVHVVPWTVIKDEATTNAFAADRGAAPSRRRPRHRGATDRGFPLLASQWPYDRGAIGVPAHCRKPAAATT